MSETEKIYNTPKEIAMRLLIIMSIIKGEITKERLFFFDFLSIHSSIIDEKSISLHPDNPRFGLEFYSKESNTDKAIHLLIHKKLINVKYDRDGYYYEINTLGKYIISLIDGDYNLILSDRVEQVSKEFSNFTERDIQKFFDQSIVNWGAVK
ncbi:ABC-three component system middle component 2 [Enterococcus hirae]|uniref:ABC-three component system middle component 2 n=1 Tax=Enterococcus hirae TaxID=1354 RepID=UPI0039A416EE